MVKEDLHNLSRDLHLFSSKRKKLNRKKKRRVKEACIEWECQEACCPCIPSVCTKLLEFSGRCETCKQKDWIICLHDLRKIPPELLV